MEEKIKHIISGFIKIPAEQITANTVIDRSAVNNSIALHRMYAKLAEAGVGINNYHDIRTVGMLLQRSGNGVTVASLPEPSANGHAYGTGNHANMPGIGIDVENIAALPKTNDFREDAFYKSNFTEREIAYCILQQDPYASFAGLFAAKEAIVKANNTYRKSSFNTIEIEHSPDGKPVFRQFQLSVSHTDMLAVAVAVSVDRATTDYITGTAGSTIPVPGSGRLITSILLLLCLLCSGLALYIALKG